MPGCGSFHVTVSLCRAGSSDLTCIRVEDVVHTVNDGWAVPMGGQGDLPTEDALSM